MYIMGFHTHQNQTYRTFTVMRAIHGYVIPVLGFSGMDYSTLKSWMLEHPIAQEHKTDLDIITMIRQWPKR